MKQKYIRLREYDEIVIFPIAMNHSIFKFLDPISAGFCEIVENENKVICYGESLSIGMESHKYDSMIASNQLFGI
jgi:hypothetical protein